MSTDSSAGVLSDPDREPAGSSRGGLSAASVLELCDRALGEIGRRQHRFGWLRATDPASGDWLPVDAYYPGRRLVVFCRELSNEDEARIAELVPARGLALLRLAPDDLGPDSASARRRIIEMTAQLPVRERRTPPEEEAARTSLRLENAISRIATSLSYAAAPAPPQRPLPPSRTEAVQRAARHIAEAGSAARPARRAQAPRTAHPPHPPLSPRQPRRPRVRDPVQGDPGAELQAMALAICLTVIVAVELYFGVARLAIAGRWWLALGLAFDACSRVLGTIAARRAKSSSGADWACATVGAPVVAAFTLFGKDGPVASHPAPLAGVLSVLATSLVLLAGLLAIAS